VVSPRADRPRRRFFTAEYKLQFLAEYEGATPGERGALLRREGLYSSHLVEWHRARDAGALAGLEGQVRPARRTPEQVELERLRWDKAKVEAELARTKAALDVVAKAHALFGTALRERGHRDAVEGVIVPAVAELAAYTSTARACALLG
jgi:transposase-like protein